MKRRQPRLKKVRPPMHLTPKVLAVIKEQQKLQQELERRRSSMHAIGDAITRESEYQRLHPYRGSQPSALDRIFELRQLHAEGTMPKQIGSLRLSI